MKKFNLEVFESNEGLKTIEEEYKEIIDQNFYVIKTDMLNNIIYVNDNIVKLLKKPLDYILGKPIYLFVSGKDRVIINNQIFKVYTKKYNDKERLDIKMNLILLENITDKVKKEEETKILTDILTENLPIILTDKSFNIIKGSDDTIEIFNYLDTESLKKELLDTNSIKEKEGVKIKGKTYNIEFRILPDYIAYIFKDITNIVETLNQKNRVDMLTRALNKGAWLEDKNSMNSSELGIAVLDIDNFKMVNDEFGHSYGDIVLSQVAQKIRNSIRDRDRFYRYGGEEFIIISEYKSIRKLAERIRKSVKSINFDKVGHKTVSIGISMIKGNIDIAFGEADKNLYKAKNEGKDMVI